MELFTLLLIAIGLSFDTFAVSVSTGLIISSIRFWQAVKVAIILTIFQSLMPFLGWLAGKQVAQFISSYDHWFAFILLGILGLKMIFESFKEDKGKNTGNPLKMSVIIGMAIATSIDALIVGVSFAFIHMNIYMSVIIIGSVTFIVAMLGMLFGKKVGGRSGKKMEIFGGIILIGIGLKILISHLNI
jgi:manganese efflux pump family protein